MADPENNESENATFLSSNAQDFIEDQDACQDIPDCRSYS